MSNSSDLIKKCRYYHGEKSNPFSGENKDKAMLWYYEKIWIKMILKEIPSDLLVEYCDYLRIHIPEYLNNDYAPMSYKALLFDRYCHFGGSTEGFKQLFSKYYITKKGT